MEDSQVRWQRYRDEAAAALAAGELPEELAAVMDLDKRDRQEQSRADVVDGRRTVDDNFFFPRAIARKFSYKFKP